MDATYGIGVGDGLRARDAVEGLPDAARVAAMMDLQAAAAAGERFEGIADRLRANPAAREAMLADVERDLAEAVDPDHIALLVRVERLDT